MTIHIMLDLETWGKTPGSDIRSIGAVVFDPVAEYGAWTAVNGAQTFYIACDNPIVTVEDMPFWRTRRYKLIREPETVKWWNEQSPEAQAAFENPVDLKQALMSFVSWIVSVSVPERQDVRLWANDPQFDVSILEAAYRAVGLPHPWHYRAPRSFRTVVEISGMSRDDMQQFNIGTAHNALDDAISQAKIICEAYKRLGLNK